MVVLMECSHGHTTFHLVSGFKFLFTPYWDFPVYDLQVLNLLNLISFEALQYLALSI